MENNVECGMCSGRGWFKICGTRWRCIDCDGTGKDPPKCECGACEYRNGAWMWYSEWMEDCTPTGRLVNVKHCPDKCGCRLSVEAGEPRVGEKYADLERDAKRFRTVEEAAKSDGNN